MQLFESELRKLVRDIIIETSKKPNISPTGNMTAMKKGIGGAVLDAGLDALIGPVGSIYSGAKKVVDKNKENQIAKQFPDIPIKEIISICKNFPLKLQEYHKKNRIPDVIEVFNILLSDYGVNYRLVKNQNTSQEEVTDTIDDTENYAGMFEPVKFDV